MAEATTVEIVEVGPRDGLQNEPEHLAPAVRAGLVRRLGDAGLRRDRGREARRPAAGAADGRRRGGRRRERPPGVTRSALVLNARGYDRLRAHPLPEVRVALWHHRDLQPAQPGPGPSSSRWQRPTRSSPPPVRTGDGSRSPWPRPSAARSRARWGRKTAWGSRSVESRRRHARRRDRAWPTRSASPGPLDRAGAASRAAKDARIPCGVHFHDTRNTGHANALAAWRRGVEASWTPAVGGLGGCPFAPARHRQHRDRGRGITCCERDGIETGQDLDRAAGGVAVGHRPARPRPAGTAAPGRHLRLTSPSP